MGLAVMALLFVWKNAVYFVRPVKMTLHPALMWYRIKIIPGTHRHAARNIPAMKSCRFAGRNGNGRFKNKRVQSAAFERVKEILRTQALSSKKKMDAVHGYRKISRTVQRTRGYE